MPKVELVEGDLSETERREVGRKARAVVLAVLSAAGGEAQRSAIVDAGLREGGFSDRELAEPAPEKARDQYSSFVEYRLSWALTNLKRDGLVENPKWSTWCLTGVAAEEPEAAVTERATPERLAELRAMPELVYLRRPEWRRTRAAALVRASHRCALDRTHTEDLEVHHNTYERVGEELASDLVVLCRECHRLHHQANGRPRRRRTRAAKDAARSASSLPPPSVTASATRAQPSRRSVLQRLLRP